MDGSVAPGSDGAWRRRGRARRRPRRAHRAGALLGGLGAVTLVVHHRVHDYDVWKPVFDEHEAVRRSHGEIEHRIYQTLGDPASVVIHIDFPSEEAARAFADDPSLAEAMKRGGVDGKPGTGFINCTERRVYAASAVR